jgi:KDO2-lipid IV(A) lauroyltransferase
MVRAMKTGWKQDLSWRMEAAAYDGLMAVLRAIPLDTASAFGGWLLRVLGPKTSTHRVADINTRLVWPDMPADERRVLLTEAWDNLGRTFAEFAQIDRLLPYVDGARVDVEGAEMLDAVRDSGRGAVFISGHFANWEVMAAAIVRRGVKCQVTYRAANNPYVDARIVKSRKAYGVDLFAPKGRDGAAELIDALKRGEGVALMNDQKFNGGVRAPFFGTEVEVAPGAARLALKFDVPIIPVSVRRTKGVHFVVTIHPALAFERTGDKSRDIENVVFAINRFVEDRIREAPPQWFWVHKRWPGDVYKKRAPEDA